MKLRSFTKKKAVAAGLAFGVAAGAGGIAAAYYLATGTGTGHVAVGYSMPFLVTQNTPVTGHLYPGTSMTVSFNIQNVDPGVQHFTVTGTDVYLPKVGTNIITALQKTGSVVPGCMASWFTTTIKSGASGTLAHNQSDTLVVKVTMTNAATSQNACQQTIPKLTVAFAGPAGFALSEAEGGNATWNGKTAATLSLPNPAPHWVTTNTAPGAGAFITVLKPSATLPTKAPTFTTTAYNSGSPRWDIYLTTGKVVVMGYPTQATHNWTAGNWQINSTLTHPAGTSLSWAQVKTFVSANSLKVTQAQIVMDTDQAAGTTLTITNVTFGGQGF